MARTRYLKPSFTEDVDLATVSLPARYLYANLWCHMDRSGVCEADTKLVKKWVFPYDDDYTQKKIEKLVAILVEEKFLYRITYGEKSYLFCPTFKKHQWFHKEEKPVHNIPERILKAALNQHCTETVVLPNENCIPNTVTVTVTGTVTEKPNTEIAVETPPEENTDPPLSTPPPTNSEKREIASALAALTDGRKHLETVKLSAQEAWVRAFGAELVLATWPHIVVAWECDEERRSQGNFGKYVRSFLTNEKKNQANGPPKKKKLRVVKSEGIPWS